MRIRPPGKLAYPKANSENRANSDAANRPESETQEQIVEMHSDILTGLPCLEKIAALFLRENGGHFGHRAKGRNSVGLTY